MRKLAACLLTLALAFGAAPPAAAYVGDAELLLDNAEAFPAIRALIAGAERSIAVDYYVLGGPQADELADLLIARQADGVAVRVLLDPDLGTLPALTPLTRRVLDRLRAAHVPVRLYPRAAVRRAAAGKPLEDHNKVVVADGVAAIATSMNLGGGALLAHEVGLRVTGHAAHAMARDVLSAFALATPLGPEAPRAWPTAALATGRGAARIAYVPVRGARAAVTGAIARARTGVDVLMAQLEDGAAIDALIAAHRRGVAVRVLIDPNDVSRLSPLGWAPHGVYNLAAAVRLAAAGVPVRWYRPAAAEHGLHAKAALIDGATLLAGSTNWNPMSFDVNNETMLAVEGGAAPGRFVTTFARDWAERGAAVEPAGWAQGPTLWAYQGLAWLLN